MIKLFQCVFKYFLNILSIFKPYCDITDNRDDFGHNNLDVKFSYRYIPGAQKQVADNDKR